MTARLVIASLILFLGFSSINAQETKEAKASVEKSMYGLQIGFLGVWGYNEMRLDDKFALRTEIGFDGGFSAGGYDSDFIWAFAPGIKVEPRWYYNLDRRKENNRRIAKNSGNFFAVSTNYHPDWFVISPRDEVAARESLFTSVKWGIRRNIWGHLSYELGLGAGYYIDFTKQYGYDHNSTGFSPDIHFRIGYTF
ncbi:MAG: hypothetical protein V7767_01155 [Leeuwenhoekiella sp.]